MKRRIRQFVTSLVLIAGLTVALSACGGSSSPELPQETLYTVEISAKDTTLLGQDKDKNGVRDDIDAFIQANVLAAARPDALNVAKAAQIYVTSTNSEQMVNAFIASNAAMGCLEEKLGAGWYALAGGIQDRTMNNPARTKAFWQGLASASGTPVGIAPNCIPALTVNGTTLRAQGYDAPQADAAAFRIVYINGVRNTEADARLALVATMKLVGPSYVAAGAKDGHPIQYEYIYNATEYLGAGDFLDSLKQKLSELNSVPWWVANAALRYVLNNEETPISGEVAAAVALLKDFFIAHLAGTVASQTKLKSATTFEDDLVRSAASRVTALASVQPVIIVAHSQGTLYANAIFWKIKRSSPKFNVEEQVHTVLVATPASGVANGDYITSSRDRLIAAVRVLFPATLVANAKPSDRGDDRWIGHNYTDAYLKRLSLKTLKELIEPQFEANSPKEKAIKVNADPSSIKIKQTSQLALTPRGFQPQAKLTARWSVVSGGGNVSKTGVFTAPNTPGTSVVKMTPSISWFGETLYPNGFETKTSIDVRGDESLYDVILQYNINITGNNSTFTVDDRGSSGGYSYKSEDKTNRVESMTYNVKCIYSDVTSCEIQQSFNWDQNDQSHLSDENPDSIMLVDSKTTASVSGQGSLASIASPFLGGVTLTTTITPPATEAARYTTYSSSTTVSYICKTENCSATPSRTSDVTAPTYAPLFTFAKDIDISDLSPTSPQSGGDTISEDCGFKIVDGTITAVSNCQRKSSYSYQAIMVLRKP